MAQGPQAAGSPPVVALPHAIGAARSRGRVFMKLLLSRPSLAILGSIGTIAAFFLGIWYDRPMVSVDIVSLDHGVPSDVKIFLPLDKQLWVLGTELESLLFLSKPEAARLISMPSEKLPPPPQGWENVRPFPMVSPTSTANLPGYFLQVNIDELDQLVKLCEMPEGVPESLDDSLKELEEQLKTLKAAETNKIVADVRAEVIALKNRSKYLPAAKKRIEELRAEWLKKFGVFVFEVMVMNSGNKPISLLSPATLHFNMENERLKTEAKIKTGENAVLLHPSESKRLTLITLKPGEGDKDRKTLQDRWGSGGCSVEFRASDGKNHSSGRVPFARQR